jgi:SagB-type dehydrogenase family enzyme
MPLPREILDRVDRVADFIRATRLTPKSRQAPMTSADLLRMPPHATQPPASTDRNGASEQSTASPATPAPPLRFNIFENVPKIALPTNLIDLPDPTLALMEHGVEALPESQRTLPQNLRTLTTWLCMAAGLTKRAAYDGRLVQWLSYPSAGATYPTEIYVAAFAIGGLEPGFYSFHPREHCLRKLRDGWETLAHLVRGRPDLNFLKSVPAALLVSTVYCRASARFGKRGYSTSLIDAGHLIENLVQTATGLGINTQVRQAINDNTMRDLIGLPPDTIFAEAESVQAMLVWADKTSTPLQRPEVAPPSAWLPTLARKAPPDDVSPFGSIQAVHQDCVAPGVGVREVRAPLTELVVLASDYPAENFPDPGPPEVGESLRQSLTEHPPCDEFGWAPMGRNQLWTINQLTFGKGAYWPLMPDGPYPALVRPFWIVHEISGLESGIWHYNVKTHRWHSLRVVVLERLGRLRQATQQMCGDIPRYGDAAAVCVLTVHWQQLLTIGGPDLFRLAYLEAGAVTQRIALANSAMGFGSAPCTDLYPDVARKLLGIDKTNWEPIYAIAVGAAIKNNG